MRFAKGFIILLAMTAFIGSHRAQAQQPSDFLQLVSSAEGVWNNLTYATTGPLWLSGEYNENTGLFAINATIQGGFGIQDTLTYAAEGAFISGGDSVILIIATPWPGVVTVKPDTVYGAFSVTAYGIAIEINGTYTSGNANLSYHMTGAFEAFGTLVLTEAASTSLPEESAALQPGSFNLAQNFPNPFNPETIISFSLPKSEFVQLKVFDILGHEIALLSNGVFPAGLNQVTFNGNDLPSGIYFYALEAGNLKSVRKMMLTE